MLPFASAAGNHLFVADGSRIYDIDEMLGRKLQELLDSLSADQIWELLGLEGRATRGWIDERPSPVPALSSISLNVAQTCNMACGYCYADEGRFGGSARVMAADVGRMAVDRLIAEAEPGADLLVGFIGGEPLLNRRLIYDIVPYAAGRAGATGRRIRFSLTTNATLLAPDDAKLFASYPFAVQVSIDGPALANDQQRPMRGGGGSYERVIRGLDILARCGRPRQLSARMTVTRQSDDLLGALEHLIDLGFDEVGFAPVLAAPAGGHALDDEDFEKLLDQMLACGRKALAQLKAGQAYPFSNFLTAMEQIHRGSHRPYPCGAGAAYLSASAEGKLYACHRLVDDPAFAMGHVSTGSDQAARAKHLVSKHVDRMQPCSICWARYLCGGGCYHEVARRGRPGCDYIRGWLAFCLGAYAELSIIYPHGLPVHRGCTDLTAEDVVLSS
ncbi:MAG: radical SAM protein [Hyphomicrobiales bacterium]|nr:radical SAM protein [Hyphomicrobiales bacterium]